MNLLKQLLNLSSIWLVCSTQFEQMLSIAKTVFPPVDGFSLFNWLGWKYFSVEVEFLSLRVSFDPVKERTSAT